MSTEAWAIVATIVVAFLGYLVTYLQQRMHSNREAQLARVNLQLRNLYGPLYSTLKANEAIWNEFRKKLWPQHGQGGYFVDGTTDEEKERWRTWMLEVFEPLNARIEKAILENGDLLDSGGFPDIFIDTLAHIAAYRALYPKWRDGEFSVHTSLIDFPAGLLAAVEPEYHKLLARQSALSGQV